MPLLVVGSVAIDTIRTPDGKEYADVLGGSCTYFSYAASFFTAVQVVGIVGDDFEQKHIDLLKSRQIDLAGLEIKPGGKTFRWAGTYSENMNDRTTDDLQFGVLGEFDPVLPASYRESKYVFLACAQPQLQLKVMDQAAEGAFIVSDTIECYIENDREALLKVLKRSDGVIINDAEVKLLLGESNMVAAAPKLLALGPKFAVIKKGEHGGLLATADEVYPFPAYPLAKVADPTGAGDSFAGGFMGYLAQSEMTDTETLRRAIARGTATASYTCEGVSLDCLAGLSETDPETRAAKFSELLSIPESVKQGCCG